MKEIKRTTVVIPADFERRAKLIKSEIGLSQTELIRRGMLLILDSIEQKYGIGAEHESTAA
jgi:hypothetical protein